MGGKGPYFKLDSHRQEAWLEDAEFLFANGVSFEDACRRIGVTPSNLTKVFERRRVRDVETGQPYTYFRAGEGEATGGWPLSSMRRQGPRMGPPSTPGRGLAHELSVQRAASMRHVPSVVSLQPEGRRGGRSDHPGERQQGAA